MEGSMKDYVPLGCLAGDEPSLAAVVVAHFYGVTVEDLRAGTRKGPRAAFARQIAMYLMHVVYRQTMAEVARAFHRDRSTAAHACHRVEDLRDDPSFDRDLTLIENLLREAAHIRRAA
jgi:chromosomal replication initiation ATPase DnaA